MHRFQNKAFKQPWMWPIFWSLILLAGKFSHCISMSMIWQQKITIEVSIKRPFQKSVVNLRQWYQTRINKESLQVFEAPINLSGETIRTPAAHPMSLQHICRMRKGDGEDLPQPPRSKAMPLALCHGTFTDVNDFDDPSKRKWCVSELVWWFQLAMRSFGMTIIARAPTSYMIRHVSAIRVGSWKHLLFCPSVSHPAGSGSSYVFL